MKLRVNVDDKWLLKQIDERKLFEEAKPSLRRIKKGVRHERLQAYLAEVAESLLIAHFEHGGDEGSLGAMYYIGQIYDD